MRSYFLECYKKLDATFAKPVFTCRNIGVELSKLDMFMLSAYSVQSKQATVCLDKLKCFLNNWNSFAVKVLIKKVYLFSSPN